MSDKSVSAIIAVKRFLSEGLTPERQPKTAEMADFWKSLSDSEKSEFASQAAAALGLELKSE